MKIHLLEHNYFVINDIIKCDITKYNSNLIVTIQNYLQRYVLKPALMRSDSKHL